MSDIYPPYLLSRTINRHGRRRIGTARVGPNGVRVKGEYNQYNEPIGTSDPNNKPMYITGLSPDAAWNDAFPKQPNSSRRPVQPAEEDPGSAWINTAPGPDPAALVSSNKPMYPGGVRPQALWNKIFPNRPDGTSRTAPEAPKQASPMPWRQPPVPTEHQFLAAPELWAPDPRRPVSQIPDPRYLDVEGTNKARSQRNLPPPPSTGVPLAMVEPRNGRWWPDFA